MNGLKTQQMSRNRFLVLGIITAVIAVIANVVAAIMTFQQPAVITPTITPIPPSTPTPTGSLLAKYSFDEGAMGWLARTHGEDQAVINAQPQIKAGQSALELEIELVGNNLLKSKGEVFVDLSSNPPPGVNAPVDLKGESISMRIYVPLDAAGNTETPNGIQIFVRDSSGKSHYGDWTNLTPDNTDRWIMVTLLPTSNETTVPIQDQRTGESIDAGFDATRITVVGLKIGSGKKFEDDFIGSIWIDEVDWQ